jgi:sphinganine-1-phosphate aldolase
MRLPQARQKVETEMAKARLEIEGKLVPSGPSVRRHLALPKEPRDLNWIIDEMDQMDREATSHINWSHGKLSGGVYHGGEDMEVCA